MVLSATIKQNVADFAKQKLFVPLHIDNYTWHSDTEGYLHGEYGLYLTARDMAKIGALYLNMVDGEMRRSYRMHMFEN